MRRDVPGASKSFELIVSEGQIVAFSIEFLLPVDVVPILLIGLFETPEKHRPSCG